MEHLIKCMSCCATTSNINQDDATTPKNKNQPSHNSNNSDTSDPSNNNDRPFIHSRDTEEAVFDVTQWKKKTATDKRR